MPACCLGAWFPGHSSRRTLHSLASALIGTTIDRNTIISSTNDSNSTNTIAMGVYGFLASVLPVWLLLAPRDYLSSYMKIGTIGALIVGVIVVNPVLKMPAVTVFTSGGGPIIPGGSPRNPRSRPRVCWATS